MARTPAMRRASAATAVVAAAVGGAGAATVGVVAASPAGAAAATVVADAILVDCSAGSSPARCVAPRGVYTLSVDPTGQSEIDSDAGEGGCAATDPPQTVTLSLREDGSVSLADETCAVCATAGCQVRILCGQSVSCPGTVVPVAQPAAAYVHSASFIVPAGPGAVTTNTVVVLGPTYCGYEGTASAALGTSGSS